MMHSENLLCCREIYRFLLLFSGRHQWTAVLLFFLFLGFLRFALRLLCSMEVASWMHSEDL
jgi:hypothetical protein